MLPLLATVDPVGLPWVYAAAIGVAGAGAIGWLTKRLVAEMGKREQQGEKVIEALTIASERQREAQAFGRTLEATGGAFSAALDRLERVSARMEKALGDDS